MERSIVDEYTDRCLYYDSKVEDFPHFTHTHSVVADSRGQEFENVTVLNYFQKIDLKRTAEMEQTQQEHETE